MTERQDIGDLLLSADAAVIAGVTPDSIRNWTRTGRLPSVATPGGVRLIRRGDLDRLIAERASK